jgi:hypothetical protein
LRVVWCWAVTTSAVLDGVCRLLSTDCQPPSVLQISLSSFAYLFSELVQYCQSRVSNVGELERK